MAAFPGRAPILCAHLSDTAASGSNQDVSLMTLITLAFGASAVAAAFDDMAISVVPEPASAVLAARQRRA
jgi:hypothetical protein